VGKYCTHAHPCCCARPSTRPGFRCACKYKGRTTAVRLFASAASVTLRSRRAPASNQRKRGGVDTSVPRFEERAGSHQETSRPPSGYTFKGKIPNRLAKGQEICPGRAVCKPLRALSFDVGFDRLDELQSISFKLKAATSRKDRLSCFA